MWMCNCSRAIEHNVLLMISLIASTTKAMEMKSANISSIDLQESQHVCIFIRQKEYTTTMSYEAYVLWYCGCDWHVPITSGFKISENDLVLGHQLLLKFTHQQGQQTIIVLKVGQLQSQSPIFLDRFHIYIWYIYLNVSSSVMLQLNTYQKMSRSAVEKKVKIFFFNHSKTHRLERCRRVLICSRA